MVDVVNTIELDELVADKASSGKVLIERDLALVNHVQVDIKVEIGNASMTIAELFALKQGDIITLNQQVNEPLTVFVAGKSVARGNLVAVENNLGVYVTEII